MDHRDALHEPVNRGFRHWAQVQRASATIDWLCAEYPHSDRATWAGRIAAGEVTVTRAGQAVPDALGVRPGDSVTWDRPPWEEPDVPTTFTICFEDAQVLVVDKPAGLPTMPAGGFLEHTLLALVRRERPSASPMHRLGRGTSGLVVFGKTEEARSLLQRAWREGAVEKTYRAVVEGEPPSAFTVNAWIGPVEHPRLGTLHAAVREGAPGARLAVTHARRVGDGRGEARAALDVDIETGRPHQIRIHMAFAGHPLVGDPLYGVGGVPKSDALPGDLGYTLRAWRVRFPDLGGGQRSVETDPEG